jgi:hypothetical protein
LLLGYPLVDFKYTHKFGCLAWYKVPEAGRKKLNVKGRLALLLSYLQDRNGYRVWDMQKRSVVKSRDVLFEDGTFPYGEPTENSPAPVMVELP